MSGIITLAKEGLFGALGGVVGDKVESLLNMGLYKGLQPTFRDLIANTFDSITDSDSDEVLGISPDGITDIINKFIDTTVLASTIIDKEIAGELFGEMVQEGVSNAIQTSLGGALQTMLNVKRGSFAGMQDYNRDFAGLVEDSNKSALGFLSAGVGLNLIATAGDLVIGGNEELEQRYRFHMNQVENILTQINTHSLGAIANSVVSVHTVVSRWILLPIELAMVYAETLRRVAEEHLARINELADSLEAIKKYYEIEDEHGNPLLPENVATIEVLKIKAEVEATQQTYNSFVSILDTIYSETVDLIMDSLDSTNLSAINTAYLTIIDEMINLLNSINSPDTSVRDNLANHLQQLLRHVAGYREFTSTNVRIT